jgi:hypothetical protein
VCDWGNDEQPYKMTPKTGELYSLGVHAYLDDNYIHLHGRRTINEVNLLWREWVTLGRWSTEGVVPLSFGHLMTGRSMMGA